MNVDDIKISQYRQISIKLEKILEFGVDQNEMITIAKKNLINIKHLVETCKIHQIPTDSLLTLDLTKLNKFIRTHSTKLNLNQNAANTKGSYLLRTINTYINNNDQPDPQLMVDAHKLFIQNFDIFKCEIENKKIQYEIKLERLKYETINKKQLNFTLAGIILTALLTIVNIIITLTADKNRNI